MADEPVLRIDGRRKRDTAKSDLALSSAHQENRYNAYDGSCRFLNVGRNMITIRRLILMLAVAQSTTFGACADDAEEQVVKVIEKLGGKVIRDDKLPEKPVVSVYLTLSSAKDADLKGLAHLKHLQKLSLLKTKVTDAGMKELTGLKELRELSLGFTDVTDAGLKELAQDSELRALSRWNQSY